MGDIPAISNGQDYASVSIQPDYFSDTDLHIHDDSPLIGKGSPFPSIAPKDYDGDLRDPITPTIGADEPAGIINLDVDGDGWPNLAEDTNGDGDLYTDDTDVDGLPDFLDPDPYFFLRAKAMLQGPYVPQFGLMHDSLRVQWLLPHDEPFSQIMLADGSYPYTIFNGVMTSTTADVLMLEGPDAIVDYVFVEMRDANDPAQVLAARPGFVQRDGDIVDSDGTRPLAMYLPEGTYNLSIKHRNHLGVMALLPVQFNRDFHQPTSIDFTSLSTQTYGNFAQKIIGNTQVMWGGDANQDGIIQFWGIGSDMNTVKSDVIQWPDNTNQNNNFMVRGYNRSDTNMDGKIITIGVGNDISKLMFYNALQYAGNTNYDIGFKILAQLP